ncbi:MAG TPA: hypothetical protein VHG72_10675 [Polyangia bacterium]|nr:hypothetical protein [Polyangia bacterium]
MVPRLFVCSVALATLAGARPAAAESYSSSAVCTTDNLLSGRQPIWRQDLRGNPQLVTDDAVGPEGAMWDAPVGVVLETPAGSLTYDLGEVRPVSAFLLQADANDTYKIFGAEENNPGAYKLLVEVDNVLGTQGHGLRTRTVSVPATPVRYLRVGEGDGDGYYSIAEFQAYCRAPTPFPPKLKIVDAPPAAVPPPPGFWKFAWWENDASSRFEMALAMAALALVGWGIWLGKQGRADFKKRLRDGLLIAVGILSFCAYWNFFAFHFGNYIHMWDTFHYYIGSKYFNELSYDRLYECVAVADSEEPGLRRRVELRKIMNLRTNMMEGTNDILAHPERCKQHFTLDRWQSFRHDVGFFRTHHDIKRWEEAQTDHGYNGSPVWNIVGTTLANTAPASDTQIKWLTRIDPLFIIGLTLVSLWAFGWRTTCVAWAVFATNFPSRFYWTGGAFLRWDWLFYLVAGVCLVKKEKPLAGGFLLGYTTLLRIFPMFIFSGPLLLMVRQIWGKPAADRPWWRPEPAEGGTKGLLARVDKRLVMILAGAALSVAIFVPISLATSNGIAGYRAFAFNTEKHKETPLTNYMGLRTVIAYSPSEAGRVMKDDRQEDPWGPWKRQKLKTFHKRFPLYLASVAIFVVLLYGSLRDAEPWVACSMGAMMIAVGVELTCYYYSFLFAVAFLYHKRREAGAMLLAATAITGLIDWSPTRYIPDVKPWMNLKWSQWLDEQYMAMSIFTLLAFGWIMYRFGSEPTEAAVEPAPIAPRVVTAPSSRKRWQRGRRGNDRRRGRAR